jgi:FixJ family two-component response regulator
MVRLLFYSSAGAMNCSLARLTENMAGDRLHDGGVANNARNTGMDKRLLVSVVDDDESVRESLPDLLKELGFAAKAFASAGEFLESDYVGETKCLILDVAMPGMSGPDLQQVLKRRGVNFPIIFVTAHADATVRARLLEQGAAECLFKPFGDTVLRDAVSAALRL